MKYVAVRVQRTLNNRFSIQAQRSDTYNWEDLGHANTYDSPVAASNLAIEAGRIYSLNTKSYIPVYGLGGYALTQFLNGEVYNKF